jgi:putative two-component system response regulator
VSEAERGEATVMSMISSTTANNGGLVLIIDDDATARKAAESVLLGQGCRLLFASKGMEGLALAHDHKPDLILLDVMMPGMDGYEVCKRLRADPDLAEIPILMISALDDSDSRLSGIEAGVDDFITKPFNRTELRARVRTILRLNRYRKLRDEHSRLELAYRELEQAYDATIEGWVAALDLRSKETAGHTQRVTRISLDLAQASGMSGDTLIHMRRGALLHDIGKLAIPDAILLKPGPLSHGERTIMRLHTVYAKEWLSGIAYLAPAAAIPYLHHEKWDGSGYPCGLKGEEIPFPARCFAIADVWDALLSERPYKAAWPVERALAHIRQNSGIHFDPQVVGQFMTYLGVADQA